MNGGVIDNTPTVMGGAGYGGLGFGGGCGYGGFGGIAPFGLLGLASIRDFGRGFDGERRCHDDHDGVSKAFLFTQGSQIIETINDNGRDTNALIFGLSKEICDAKSETFRASVTGLLATKDLATETALGFGDVNYKAMSNFKDTELLISQMVAKSELESCRNTGLILTAIKQSEIEALKDELFECRMEDKFEKRFSSMGQVVNNLAFQVGTIGSAISQIGANAKV